MVWKKVLGAFEERGLRWVSGILGKSRWETITYVWKKSRWEEATFTIEESRVQEATRHAGEVIF